MKSEWRRLSLLLITALVINSWVVTSVGAGRPILPPYEAFGTGERYVRTELFFGLSRKGLPEIWEGEFQQFIDEFVTPRFPKGLTILDALGQWREDDSTTAKEPSKVMILIYSTKSAARLGERSKRSVWNINGGSPSRAYCAWTKSVRSL